MNLETIGLRDYILSFYRGDIAPSFIGSKNFYKNFYVSQIENNDSAKELKCKLLTLLSNNDTHYILLKGHAGSGKSIFVDALLNKDSNDNLLNSLPNTEVCILDWQDISKRYYYDIKKKIKKTYKHICQKCSIQRRNEIYSSIISFQNIKPNAYRALYEALKKLFVDPYSIKYYNWENDTNIDYSLQQAFRLDISNAANEMANTLDNDLPLLVGLLILLLKYEHPKRNIIILHDNVEATNENGINIVKNLIIDLPDIVNEIENHINSYCRLHHIFVCRTTNSTFLSFHEITRHGCKIFPLCDFDFATNALLLKRKYLLEHKHNPLLLNKLDLIIKLLLDKNQEEDTNKYITRNFFPLLSYSFRNVINYTSTAIEEYPELLTKLLNEESLHENECINGAREVLLYSTFRNMKDSTLQRMGIGELDGTANHSYARILLNYLYWFSYKKRTEEIALNQIYHDLNYFFGNKIVFTNTVKQLSIFNKEPADCFSHLIDFTNLEFFQDLNKEDLSGSGLQIKLTESGKLFVEYYSIDFEFFNARLKKWHGPLFNIDKPEKLNSLLKDVHTAIKQFTLAMLQNGKLVCRCYNTNSEKGFCNIENNNPFRCSLFTRLRQVIWCIAHNIDYVDRYRLYCSDNYKNNISAGKEMILSCLNFIKELTEIYESIDDLIFSGDSEPTFIVAYNNWKMNNIFDSENTFRLANKCHYYDKISFVNMQSKLNIEIEKVKSIISDDDWAKYCDNITTIYKLVK